MKERQNPYIILTVILFVCMLAFPAVHLLCHRNQATDSQRENRTLASLPALNLAHLDKYPAQFDSYFNDHFPFRDQFLDAYFLYSLFNGQSPTPSVVIGKEDFLFCGKEEKELFEGKLEFTEEQMKRIADELAQRYDTLKQMGIRFYVFLAPTSYEIHPEYLPSYLQGAPETATEKFCRVMRQRAPQVPLTYLKSTLLHHKGDTLLYRKNDNHWNLLGAEFGAEKIMETLSKDNPMLPSSICQDFVLTPYVHEGGNLYTWVSIRGDSPKYLQDREYYTVYTDTAFFIVTEDTVQDYTPTEGFAYPYEYEKQFRTNRTDQPKILFVRDSYCNNIIPFVTPYFRESLFIFDAWQYGANWDIIRQEKPDIVVLMIYEPHIRNIFKTLEFSCN
ncbi:MAG: hypothetical protein IK013_02065 [Bacteroidales bacterium]|nr:hypothetical protein [Bacteroidales bacterium]